MRRRGELLERAILELYGPKEVPDGEPIEPPAPNDRARAIELEWYAHPRPSPYPRASR